MSVLYQKEYVASSGNTVSIQYDTMKRKWEVASWLPDESNHWYKEFDDKSAADAEFNRWRT